MASAELSRRVEKVVGYPPLSELGELQRMPERLYLLMMLARESEDGTRFWGAAKLRIAG